MQVARSGIEVDNARVDNLRLNGDDFIAAVGQTQIDATRVPLAMGMVATVVFTTITATILCATMAA